MADVVLSYSRADAERVGRLVSCLESYGVSVWWDRSLEHDANFGSVIEREIQAARLVIVCWSASARESTWVKEEATEAQETKKYAGCMISPGRPGFGFVTSNVADLSLWDGSADDATLLNFLHEIGARLNNSTLLGLSEAARQAELRRRNAESAAQQARRIQAAKAEEDALRHQREVANAAELRKLEAQLDTENVEAKRRGWRFWLAWPCGAILAALSIVTLLGIHQDPEFREWPSLGKVLMSVFLSFGGLLLTSVPMSLLFHADNQRQSRALERAERLGDQIDAIRTGIPYKPPRRKIFGIF